MQVFTAAESAAALFQAGITIGLAVLFLVLYVRYRKRHFQWWAIGFGLYGLGLAAIVSFLITGVWAFLYWHQVIIGWTALALLYAALVFSRQMRWRWWYLGLLAFPAVWSAVAIFWLDSFGLAAGPAVAFLALTTGWTGVVFWRYRRLTGSAAAAFLAATLLLWALHHLDYPILRARGAWNPWGYFIDAMFVLAVGVGILQLVVEEFRQGLITLTALSADLRRPDLEEAEALLLRRPLGLRGVRGAALVRPGEADQAPALLVTAGSCDGWKERGFPARVTELVEQVWRTGRAVLEGDRPRPDAAPPFTAVVPLGEVAGVATALVVVGEVAAPFAVLDDSVLSAVGAQIGAALTNVELMRALEARGRELERLSARMIRQHEEQGRRVARELHDETAQVFSALKLQTGSLLETVPEAWRGRVTRILELVDVGTRSIRAVIDDLRPAALDDLGLVPAIRALTADFREWSGLAVELRLPDGGLPSLTSSAELALYRAVQEGLSNVARHAQAQRVEIGITQRDGRLALTIADDGVGIPGPERDRLAAGAGRSGLFGMRERLVAEGGWVALEPGPNGGLILRIGLPVAG
jgi:signal transduction histidine kinase